MTTMTTWNTNLDDLQSLALAVRTTQHHGRLGARTVAQCLSGVVGLVATRYGVPTMQEACADLVRTPYVWEHAFGRLPHDGTGQVPEPIALIATVARGILSLAGEAAVRQALSYWATETDPVAWMSLAK